MSAGRIGAVIRKELAAATRVTVEELPAEGSEKP